MNLGIGDCSVPLLLESAHFERRNVGSPYRLKEHSAQFKKVSVAHLALRKVRVSPPTLYHCSKYSPGESTSGYEHGRNKLDDTPGFIIWLKKGSILPIIAVPMGKAPYSLLKSRHGDDINTICINITSNFEVKLET
jgi:hypothetical protein